MVIWIKRETLSDGSHVFDVRVPHMLIPARDESSAQRLADAIQAAVADYGVGEDADVKFNY